MIRGIGQKSVVRIFGSSISLASKDVRGATGGSSDDSSHATCDTFAYRYPQDVGLRFTARWLELRRGGVTNGCAIRETVGSKPLPLGSGERASALRTTRQNASRSCSMRPNPLHGVGARFSQVGLAGIGASRCTAQEAAEWQSDPKRAVPARMTRDARGRTRPSEAPPAVRREGSAPEPKAPPAGTF